ncbi:MAG: sulfurtransferase [Thermodesulfobacteriota bacterium]
MRDTKILRFILIAVVLFLGVVWSLASAEPPTTQGHEGYPNGQFLCTGQWLKANNDDEGLVVIDVRTDEHFDNTLIPGAIRIPYTLFRTNNRAENVADDFVGLDKAQEILGEHGVARGATVVLYDSVERDGGATASYVFWVLDMLGHENKMILERGIDGWKDAGGEVSQQPAELSPVLYQASTQEMVPSRRVNGEFIQNRLGDPYYQIVDVRSQGEYTGELANKALDGSVLKRGHVPGAVNVPDASNWVDEKDKEIRPYAQLQDLYRGLDTNRAIIPYCHSGRRASFGYFILRLMGFTDVRLYERSWNEWGQHDLYFPVQQTTVQRPGDSAVPQGQGGSAQAPSGPNDSSGASSTSTDSPQQDSSSGGYVSCGG